MEITRLILERRRESQVGKRWPPSPLSTSYPGPSSSFLITLWLLSIRIRLASMLTQISHLLHYLDWLGRKVHLASSCWWCFPFLYGRDACETSFHSLSFAPGLAGSCPDIWSFFHWNRSTLQYSTRKEEGERAARSFPSSDASTDIFREVPMTPTPGSEGVSNSIYPKRAGSILGVFDRPLSLPFCPHGRSSEEANLAFYVCTE